MVTWRKVAPCSCPAGQAPTGSQGQSLRNQAIKAIPCGTPSVRFMPPQAPMAGQGDRAIKGWSMQCMKTSVCMHVAETRACYSARGARPDR